MKTFAKTISILLMLLFVLSCNNEETILPAGDESPDVLKGAVAKGITTPIDFSGDSFYEGYVPKTGDELFAGTLPCLAKLIPEGGQSYVLEILEGFPGFMERHVDLPLKISPGGVVKGYWPEEWMDFEPPEGGYPNTDVLSQITGHLGCDLHGPGISKGTINCTGTFNGTDLVIIFRFNGLDNGEESTMGPDAVWNLIDGPAIFEFSYILHTPPTP